MLGRLTGQPLEAPKKEGSPKKGKAAPAAREPEPPQMTVHADEEKAIVGRTAAAIRARLEMKIDDVRYDDARFRDLGVCERLNCLHCPPRACAAFAAV